MNLLQNAQQLQQEADQVIQLTDVEKTFADLGKITYVGSYVYQLLYRRDIDFFVQDNECSYEKAKKATLQLINSDRFQTVGFADWTEQKPPNNLKGFYWELIYYLKGKKWKFDVWYTKEQNIKSITVKEKILAKLKEKPQARKKILELKQKHSDGFVYTDGYYGFKIYEHVLGKLL